MRKAMNARKILVGKPEGKITLEDLGVDGTTVLKYKLILINKAWIELKWLRIGMSGEMWTL